MIVFYAIGPFILMMAVEALIFPGCVSENPELCHIVDVIVQGLFIVLLLSIIAAGVRGGLPGHAKTDLIQLDRPVSYSQNLR